ncbi:hypothetical protein A3A76_02275 [Candidatus Woesebacteria bacterium RIFCSPLOWO2_01_FULL_39_23]|uniref:PPM-type phosphatase domain-containing protein n=1 Tax=Candidatus Woesebacteria bacterium RIFCSPHIGHO2_01_FULL_40_22 TaxID=1802499 RepID=A0A1F7YFX7_9BACT|nr:MAG: hypothetical protein A2141_03430 [Candidatus Woesebacteria bacterium RBG_16_40_11]OGM26227.1 MAG: hypothetical protein A2628_02710 [Candidatus Woesebacteria bacterium RIFCSPHIGHO2_01_FULL_40_22]OGM36484.1 MAG: hypothetical protein A3E41_00530 [Candidatus Woesebacteria bacterium RIFCSPHIGHO2_12_FULL_38_9]OGM62385.1 MAG: hypothetical protein A3A76_02275 [Candidatus Woesebacteria bacterium RIFCSPLOWO2_01_FULL_39_23]
MSLNIVFSKLTGTPGESGWSQVHEYIPQEEEKKNVRGRLVAVFATGKSEQGLEDVALGRECLSRLHEEYFGNLEKSAFNCLRDSVKKTTDEFQEILPDLEIAAAVFLDNAVYTAAASGGQVVIYRNGMLAKIIESKRREVVSASGYPKEGDSMVLGTRAFFSEIVGGTLKAALEKDLPLTSTELLAPMAHSSSLTGRIACVVVKFEKEKMASGIVDFLKKENTSDQNAPLRIGYRGLRADKIKGFLGKIFSSLPAKKIYVRVGREDVPKQGSKKSTFLIGIILIVLLLVSIIFGVNDRARKTYKAAYSTELTKANHEYEEAVTLIDVDATRARELFLDSRAIVSTLLTKGIKDPDLSALGEKIKNGEGVILGEFKEDADMFVDLTILTNGFSGEKIAYSEGEAYVFDGVGKKVISVVLASKRSKVFAGPSSLEDGRDIAPYVGKLYVLKGDGIYDVTDKSKKVIDKDWGDESLIFAYGANIYVLDWGNSEIFRFVSGENGFSSRARWLSPGVTGEFSDVGSWVIDGSIWLLKEGDRIIRYNAGNRIAFDPRGVPIEIKDAIAIYTNEELIGMYILMPNEKTVVVLDKDGEYKGRYISDRIGEAKGLVVSEKEKKIILLTGEKLYSIELKHL